jgi:Tudor domain
MFISEVSSPTRFWVQSNEGLQQLMKSLDHFYSNEKNLKSFSVDSNNISIGIKVAVFSCNLWHRGRIISNITENGFLKVFLFDFGTTGFFELKNIKILLEEFAQLRNFAHRAALYGIVPDNNKRLWDLKTTDKLINIIYDKKLKMEIIEYHQKVRSSDVGNLA